MVSNKIISVVGFNLPSDIASGRIAEMHRRICHALHDVHLAARMPRAFLNMHNYEKNIHMGDIESKRRVVSGEDEVLEICGVVEGNGISMKKVF